MDTNLERKLAKLVAMPTLYGDTTANDMALDYLEDFFAGHGLRCARRRFDGEDTLVASSQPHNAQHPAVLLAAHTDVIPADQSLFAMRTTKSKLFGRGVFDMKFAIAGYMQLVEELGPRLADYDFAIMITTNEEGGSPNGRYGTERLVEAGLRPGACFMPDATAPGWDIEELAKGWWRFELTATGKTAHSSRPWEGESASMKLIHALHDLKGHFKNQGPLTDTLNVGSIHGDGVFNKIPDHMVAQVEIRLVGDQSAATNQRLIDKLCATYGVSYHTHTLVGPMHAILDHPLVDAYLDAVSKVTGHRPAGHISQGGSDAPFFTNAGIPCIISCPEGGGHHTDDEWVSRSSLAQLVPILRDYLERAAKTTAAPVDTHLTPVYNT